MDPEHAPQPEPRAIPAAAERANAIDDLLDVEVRDGAPGSPLHRRRLVRRIAGTAGACMLVAAALASLQDHGVEKHDGAAQVAEHASATKTRGQGANDQPLAASDARSASHVASDERDGADARDASSDGDSGANGAAKQAASTKNSASRLSAATQGQALETSESTKPISTKERGSRNQRARSSTTTTDADGAATATEPAVRPAMSAAELREARRELDRELAEANFDLERGDAPAARRRWYALLARADGIGDAELRGDVEARAGFAIARSYTSAKEASR